MSISGFVKDASTGEPISSAYIYSTDAQISKITNDLGYFEFNSICPGGYHFTISHLGCETLELYFDVSQDTSILVELDHNSQLLNEVAIVGRAGENTTQESKSLNSANIAQNADKDLATMLENVSGVSTINNGSGISKPVIHGLYGNRISIINNGIAQSGQQWGSDHSPEIDPLVANRITVVKGVGALEYQGNSLGGIVLVEPYRIDHEPHVHGSVRYIFESNGLGNGLNLELQQYNKWFAWRIVGTLKKSGDHRTSSYYLNNTGNQEANIAIQLEKSWNEKWFSEFYFSSFNADLGILRGSQIGNLTDLEDALERDVPFYTEDNFSYSIDAPFQRVNHHLLKFHTEYYISDHQRIDLTYSGQYNHRREFDVRRSGRSEIPALSLEQFTHFLEAKYNREFQNQWKLKSGLQINQVDNQNIPETGILPLIPDYLSHEYGLFALLSRDFSNTTIDFGGRYDFENRKVAAISFSVPREILRYNTDYHNFSAIAGIKQQVNSSLSMAFNLGYAARNPEVNELYSNGLHQGVSGIEEGDPDLSIEKSLKTTFSIHGRVGSKLSMEALVYHQQIGNYIFLNPQDEIRLTIRGAFPVFRHEQTDASITGFDLAATYLITDQLNVTGKYSYLYGYDQSNDIPLVYMPANNLYGEINYRLPELDRIQKVEFQINSRYVQEQTNLLSSQDFAPPPPAYLIMGVKASAETQLRRLRLKMFLRVENLLNTSYRDYLNRQRYFADDLGVNFILGINILF